MSASYFDLLKYAATGIASPDMTYYDRMRASALMGGVAKTLTGQPPLSFKSDGSPLISWSMKGSGSQSGTPTPNNPVMPTFCGVRTGNLFDIKSWLESKGAVFSKDGCAYTFNSIQSMYSTPFYFSDTDIPVSISGIMTDITTDNARIHLLRANGTTAKSFAISTTTTKTESIVCAGLRFDWTTPGTMKIDSLMLNLGSTALPYEPYGWAEKITCAGQTTPVYLGEVQTVRRVKKLVLDGTEAWYAASTTQGNTRFTKGGAIDANADARSNIICTHLAYNTDYNKVCVFITANLSLSITMPGEMTAADFKSYLAAQYAAGHPVTVWYVLATPETGITNEPLAKIGDYADELHSEDSAVTIPTAKGQNTLTVDTTLQPSEMSITYKG